ncbi:MAG: DnaA ATPase domain-containing protein, partial [Candidatus Hinthialibacter sp.]
MGPVSASPERSDVRELWRHAENLLRQQISVGDVNDWFEDVRIQECLPNNVILGVPTNFRREYIDKNFRAVLTGIFSDLLQRDVSVEIQMTDSPSGKPSERAAVFAADSVSSPPPVFDPLNTQYLFDNFVIGTSNKMAHAAAEAVARAPAQSYNPLFVYGGVGLGKTHLMQAIGNEVLNLHPEKRVVYVSAEHFVNIFIDAIKRNERLSFQT